MKFEIRGLRAGVVETLSIDATTADDAGRMAVEQRIEVLSVRVLGESLRASQRFDLTLFSQELAELLDAGLSVVEAVDTLAHQQGGNDASKTYIELVKSLRQGHTFSVALEKMPHCFPPLYIGLIRAAEKTSDLHGALVRYLEYSARLDGLKNRIISALIYPAILFVVGGGVIVFLLTFVVPRFSSVYRGSGRELPFLSSLLLDWGSFVSRYAHEFALLAAVVVCALAIALLRARRGTTLEKMANMIPGIRYRIRLFRLSRLYLTVGTLLNGGMPVVAALNLCRGIVGSVHRAQLDATVEALRRGGAISAALAQNQLTTPVSARLLQAGEGTGRMGDLFLRAGRYHDNELARWVERFSKSFEPILMSVIGLVIGGIVILLYMPIFDLAGGLR